MISSFELTSFFYNILVCIFTVFSKSSDFYIRQMNGVKLAEIMFSLFVCVSMRTQSHWFEWAEWRIVFDSCVKSWEYFRTDNISLETSLYWLSEDIVRFKIELGVEEKCTKMLTPFPMDFPQTPQHAVIIVTSLSLAGIYCARTLLGRRVCKRIDVYVITLSCTWWI